MDAPVRAAEGGVRFNPERMEAEKIYHCVFGGKLLLVFKDTQEFVHCYEVEEPELVKMAESAPPGGIDGVLHEYVNTLNKKPSGAPDVRELAEQSRDAEDILSEFASKKAGAEVPQEGRAPDQGGPAEAPPDAGAPQAGSQPDGGEPGKDGAGEQAEGSQVDGGEPGKDGAGERAEGSQVDGGEPGKSGAGERADGGAEPKDGKPEPPERNVIFVGTKPIMTYINATLQQMASYKVVTIKARGKRITQAVDVSQMIVKRMNAVGYVVSDVRISSDSLKSQDGRERNVSTIELDIARS